MCAGSFFGGGMGENTGNVFTIDGFRAVDIFYRRRGPGRRTTAAARRRRPRRRTVTAAEALRLQAFKRIRYCTRSSVYGLLPGDGLAAARRRLRPRDLVVSADGRRLRRAGLGPGLRQPARERLGGAAPGTAPSLGGVCPVLLGRRVGGFFRAARRSVVRCREARSEAARSKAAHRSSNVVVAPSTRAPGRAGWARRWAQSSGARGGFSTLLGACEVRHHFAARRRALKTSRFRSERCSTTRGGRRSRRPAGPRSPRSS